MISTQAKGILIPVGGNEDKGHEENEMYTLEFIQEGILFHVVREAGGGKCQDCGDSDSIKHTC
jgi:hypothetical protein